MKKTKREIQLEEALKNIIDRYVKNQGSEHEFITCITPPGAGSMTYQQRRASSVWRLFDDARELLQDG